MQKKIQKPRPTPARREQPAGVYLIHGENELAVTDQAREIIQRLIPASAEALSLEVIPAQAGNVAEALECIDQCRAAIQTVSLLGGPKAVWLRNASFLDQGLIGKSRAVRERLQTLADILSSGLPADQLLVITSPKVDAASAFFKACQAAGQVLEFKLGKPWQRDKPAADFAAQAFRKLGLNISGSVLQAFMLKVGNDQRRIQQEAEKLALYLGEQHTVRQEHIAEITSASREFFGFNLEDAVAKRDLTSALRLLRQLLFQNEKPMGLIFGLENRFRSLAILRAALAKKWLSLSGQFLNKGRMNQEQEDFLYQTLNDNRLKNPYLAAQRAQQALAFSAAELDQRRAWILATRRQLVSSALPDRLALEMLIIKLCQPGARAGQGG